MTDKKGIPPSTQPETSRLQRQRQTKFKTFIIPFLRKDFMKTLRSQRFVSMYKVLHMSCQILVLENTAYVAFI